MSSTSGLKSGDLLHEIQRLRDRLERYRRKARQADQLRKSRDTWRQRALAAEWANRAQVPTRKEPT